MLGFQVSIGHCPSPARKAQRIGAEVAPGRLLVQVVAVCQGGLIIHVRLSPVMLIAFTVIAVAVRPYLLIGASPGWVLGAQAGLKIGVAVEGIQEGDQPCHGRLVLLYRSLDLFAGFFGESFWKRDGDSRPPLLVVKHGSLIGLAYHSRCRIGRQPGGDNLPMRQVHRF
jgi:hypothetical protein